MDEIADWNEFLALLEQYAWTPSDHVEGGTIYTPSAELENALADAEWFQAEWYWEDTPEGIEHNSLLFMNWISHGAPISFDGTFEYVQVGEEAAYLIYFLEGIHDTPELLAKIVPAHTPAAFRKLFLEIMANDRNLMAVPDEIRNGSPELLDQATVRQGVRQMLERIEGDFGGGWLLLAEILESSEEFGQSSSDGNPEEDSSLSESGREAMLDSYFDEHYTEAGDE